MKRRQLLKLGATFALGASLSARLYAAPNAPAKLLVVFLRGGYDANNLLVPIASSYYFDMRPNIAIARPGSGPDAALSLDSNWGLHPALRSSMYPLFTRNEAAFVAFCGTDDLSRSHFETQDSIELGQPLNGPHNYRSGFLNRLVAELTGSRPIAFTDHLPLALHGDKDIPNLALRGLGRPGVDTRESHLIAAMYQRTNMAPQVNEGFGVRDEVLATMAPEMAAASRNALTAGNFLQEARHIGKLLRERFDLGFVDIGGWDTHVGEGGANGYLAGRLDALGQGLAAIAEESGPAWRNTVVVVLSEFGRTFRENGNRGTDHGHATVYWVLGGAVRGGRIVGEQIELTATSLFQNRDMPVLNEYRAVLGGLFARLYGLDATRLARVFPGAHGKDLGLV